MLNNACQKPFQRFDVAKRQNKMKMRVNASNTLQVSKRVQETDAPCIVKTKQMMASRPGALSLAQGVVHWQPPPQALQIASELLLTDPSVNSYGPAEGLPPLREALRKKLKDVNGLTQYNVMVTAGTNQAFTNVVLTLCDANDSVVLFKPYYFNHLMAIQMSGGGRQVVFGPTHPDTCHPDLEWLEATLTSRNPPPKMVVITNPCNPTGATMSEAEVARAAAICARAGTFLIMDNTYEDFLFDGAVHFCPSGPNIIHLFSFSKAYGMMGWRIGYVAYPDMDGADTLGQQLLKVQDTIPICAPQLSQHVALAALTHGADYVKQNIQQLESNRATVLDALSPLGTRGNGIAGGEGAIFLWARLPAGCEDDEAVVSWLVKEHGVAVIPGTACGAPGHIRASFANLKPDVCQEAAGRLKAGLQQLAAQGPEALKSSASEPVFSSPAAGQAKH